MSQWPGWEENASHIAFQPSLLGFVSVLETGCKLHDSTAQSPFNNISPETLNFRECHPDGQDAGMTSSSHSVLTVAKTMRCESMPLSVPKGWMEVNVFHGSFLRCTSQEASLFPSTTSQQPWVPHHGAEALHCSLVRPLSWKPWWLHPPGRIHQALFVEVTLQKLPHQSLHVKISASLLNHRLKTGSDIDFRFLSLLAF